MQSHPIAPAAATIVQAQRLCRRLEGRDIDDAAFLDRAVHLVSGAIGCSRTGFWLLGGAAPRCLIMHDAIKDRMLIVSLVLRLDLAEYLGTLTTTGLVAASNVQQHYATAGIFGAYLEPSGVRSLLAASMPVGGAIFAAITCAQVDRAVEWQQRQTVLLRLLMRDFGWALARLRPPPDAETDGP